MKSKHPYWLELCFKRPIVDEMVHISGIQDAYAFVKEHIDVGLINHKEYFWAILLTRSHRVLGMRTLSHGTTKQTMVCLKELAQVSILSNACSCIVVHNHPSGALYPSECDKRLTKRIEEVFKLFDISLIDHLILTQEGYYSFSEQGLISQF